MDILNLDPNLKIVLILTFGFSIAGLLGYITQKAKLSPILGYLLGGYLIGPYSPGFVADLAVSEQLAEIGVILMMFGVGLHFKLRDLLDVKTIAIPGAIGQTFSATVLGILLIYFYAGWSIEAGIILGLAIAVASTVVLVRVLSDNHLLKTPQGHAAVGWLIIEDLLTVLALLSIPILDSTSKGATLSLSYLGISIATILFKFILLVAIMFTFGKKIAEYFLMKVARTRLHELFTLAVMAIIFLIATGSTLLFGTSLALGAFIAGMVIGQTHVRHQALTNALPLTDVFVVIFFLSIGMLFNPTAIANNFFLFLGVLTIILIVKPLTAFFIVSILGYPFKTAITLAFALAQIGEFSFILSEEATRFNILPDDGYDIIVACALISISLNPLLFKLIDYLSIYREKKRKVPFSLQKVIEESASPKAIVIGYGNIGKNIAYLLKEKGYTPIIIDLNIDTISDLISKNQYAIYGDAVHRNILESAQIDKASVIFITISNIEAVSLIGKMARTLKKNIPIIAKTTSISDKRTLQKLNIQTVCNEEEIGNAFKKIVNNLEFALHP